MSRLINKINFAKQPAKITGASVFKAGIMMVLVAVFASLGFSVSNSLAQTWSEPGSAPPNPNISAPIWNQTTVVQGGPGSFNIAGSGYIGTNLGVGTSSPSTQLSIYNATSGPVISLSGINTVYRGTSIKNTAGTEQWFQGADSSNNFVIRRSASANDIVVNSSGYVGVGASNPLAKLHVSNSSVGSGADTEAMRLSYFNALNTAGHISMFDGDGITETHRITYGLGAATTNGYMAFSTYNSGLGEAMRILGNGNLGIGTTNPGEKLEVNGRVVLAQIAAPATTTNKLYNVGGNLYWNGTQLGGGGSSQWVDGTGGIIYYNGGNVGIGTTGPNEKLVIGTDIGNLGANTAMVVADAAADSGIYVGQANGVLGTVKWTYNATPANAAMQIVTAGYTNPVKIDASSVLLQSASTGNVGIGTATPNNKLQVAGLINFDDANMNTFVGRNAGISNTAGTTNSAFGNYALNANTTGLANSAFGLYALRLNTAGNYNSAFGSGALNANAASNNSAFGASALSTNTTGVNNSSLGFYALYSNTTGYSNSALGNAALYYNTTGQNNSAFGESALAQNTTASGSSAFGSNALRYNTAAGNSAFGNQALYSNTSGLHNSAFGHWAAYWNTTGSENSAFGISAMFANTTGVQNSAFGNGALYTNSTGSYNSAFGDNTLSYATTASYNSAFGDNALMNVSTGGNNSAFGASALTSNGTGYNNAAFGRNALYANTTGYYNDAFGDTALYSNSSGFANSAFGDSALRGNTTGATNSAFGSSALYNNTTAQGNSAFGYSALYAATGGYNSGFGSQALYANTTGTNNTAFGNGAGSSITTGTYNTFIGNSANTSSNAVTNSTAIGNGAQVTASNQIVIGNASVTQTLLKGQVSTLSYVGIGTTAPTYPLHISNASSEAGVRMTWGSSDMFVTHGGWTMGAGKLGIGDGAAPSIVVVASNDAVGIGTTSPTGKLNLKLSGQGYMNGFHVTRDAANTNTWAITVGGDNKMYFGYAASTPTAEGNFTQKMVMDTLGGMAVTSFTTGTLVATGNAWISGSLHMTGNTMFDGYGGYANIYGEGSGISGLKVNGTLVSASDKRLKKNIADLDSSLGLGLIEQLDPVSFNWKDSKFPEKQFGFIAQDVRKVMPDLVSEGRDGMLGLNYTGLIAPAVKAIQELNVKVDADKADTDKKIDSLQKQIDELKESMK